MLYWKILPRVALSHFSHRHIYYIYYIITCIWFYVIKTWQSASLHIMKISGFYITGLPESLLSLLHSFSCSSLCPLNVKTYFCSCFCPSQLCETWKLPSLFMSLWQFLCHLISKTYHTIKRKLKHPALRAEQIHSPNERWEWRVLRVPIIFCYFLVMFANHFMGLPYLKLGFSCITF